MRLKKKLAEKSKENYTPEVSSTLYGKGDQMEEMATGKVSKKQAIREDESSDEEVSVVIGKEGVICVV